MNMENLITIITNVFSAIAAICSAVAAYSANKIANNIQLENKKNDLILKPINKKLVYHLPLKAEEFLSNTSEKNLKSLDDLLLNILEISTVFKFTNSNKFLQIQRQITTAEDAAVRIVFANEEEKSNHIFQLRTSIEELLKVFYNDLFKKI